ncbi:MAG: methyltransferase domain-containing protein [Chloroflexi bacterium]|nr:methyltransferase domain-containing protein [Chloroflexota bacterium]
MRPLPSPPVSGGVGWALREEFWEGFRGQLGFVLRGRHRQAVAMMKRHHAGGGRLLDVGCGGGGVAALLREACGFGEVFGADISEESVARARSLGVSAVQLDLDAQDLPFEGGFFDAAFCGEVLEHVVNADHLLEELYRSLRPGGVAVLTTANLAAWHNRIGLGLFGWQPFYAGVSYRYTVGHPRLGGQVVGQGSGRMRPCTLSALRELLALCGFEPVEVRGWGYFRDGDGGHPLLRAAALVDRVCSRIPSLAGNLIVAVKKPAPGAVVRRMG